MNVTISSDTNISWCKNNKKSTSLMVVKMYKNKVKENNKNNKKMRRDQVYKHKDGKQACKEIVVADPFGTLTPCSSQSPPFIPLLLLGNLALPLPTSYLALTRLPNHQFYFFPSSSSMFCCYLYSCYPFCNIIYLHFSSSLQLPPHWLQISSFQLK